MHEREIAVAIYKKQHVHPILKYLLIINTNKNNYILSSRPVIRKKVQLRSNAKKLI